MLRHLALALLLAACSRPKPNEHPDPMPASELVARDIAARALAMSEDGWIVSREADGSTRDRGDSLIFTGIAMGAMACDQGAEPEAALVKMLHDRHGGVYRHPSIPDDYSLDGLLGLWWGISRRTAKCPDTRPLWAGLIEEHAHAVTIEPFFRTALDQLVADLGQGGGPSVFERGILGSEVAGWAASTVGQHAASYRLHLGFLTLSLVSAPAGKKAYCNEVPTAKIALVEHFCGRSGLGEWVAGFAYDRYVYAFQRGAWETPDASGKTTPAIDLLIALDALYP